MSPNILELRSIHSLLNERFIVPRYQRGYRWTEQQVTALLEDIADFQRRSALGADPNAYYCLQPVVVHQGQGEAWEVIDGQQRLTTLRLVLRCQREVARMMKRGCYRIKYDTRPDSEAFLEDPNQEDADKDIDRYHIFRAYQAIQAWFERQDGGANWKLLACITGPDGDGPNVRVIWYQLADDQNPVAAFLRLNVGQIRLTSAELIRALLLRSDEGSKTGAVRPAAGYGERTRIAQEWDAIERRLQDEPFWYFLQSGKEPPPARIEHVFDVFVRSQPLPAPNTHAEDPLATFFDFQRYLENQGGDLREAWSEVKRVAQTLEEWFEDRILFHLVGYLIAVNTFKAKSPAERRKEEAAFLVTLLKAKQSRTGSAFDRYLRWRAWKSFRNQQVSRTAEPDADITQDQLEDEIAAKLAELAYDENNIMIRRTLLLFNVAGLLQNRDSTQRFQFEHYKTNSWDIEHIRSVAYDRPASHIGMTHWLQHAQGFLSSEVGEVRGGPETDELRSEIQALLDMPSPHKERFGEVFDRVRELSGEATVQADDDAISNLTLLDMGTNRSYKNAVFPFKRRTIIALDRDGMFVPPATRNVFLKYYNPRAAQLMLWDAEDQRAYGKALQNTLIDFFQPLVREEGLP